MWSGPRTVSTALMRAWESRPDTAVVDEPLYAHYLVRTGRDHPGRDAILKAQPTDWRVVADALTGPVPAGRPVFYQKHMAHHLFPDMEGPWLDAFRHAFLVREPRALLASLAKVLPDPSLEETGLPQQVRLLKRLRAEGQNPPVVRSRDVLQDPEGTLRALCRALGVPFSPPMLAWAPGPRPSDGVWAEHWYASTWASTGFAPYRPSTAPVPPRLQGLLAEMEGLFAVLTTADDRPPTAA